MSGFNYSLAAIAEAVGGKLLPAEHGTAMVARVSIDSRNADAAADTLFIALRGPRHDGHDHIAALQRKGLRNFMVHEDRASGIQGANVLVVPDTLAALQRFAAWHRSHFTIPVIGITGSNGKTIVKEWLWQMLHREENIVRSPGSWNSQVGVPLSVLQMGPEHTLGIFEAGISKPGEMEKLEPIIRPTIGVLTNIGDAHDEGFKEMEADSKATEKCRLFRHCARVFCSDDQVIEEVLQRVAPNAKRCTWGPVPPPSSTSPTVVIKGQYEEGNSTVLELELKGASATFHIPFTDDASIQNATTCIALLLDFGKSAAFINERLSHLLPVEMRMRILKGSEGTTLVDDSYSLDENSLWMAIDHLQRLSHGRQKVVVLSDVLQSAWEDATLYSGIGKELERQGVSQFIGVGPRVSACRELLPKGSRFFSDVKTMLQLEAPRNFAGAVVLIKGARYFGFERIVERWQQQVHGTELEIDLEAIRHNLNHYRAMLAPGVRTMAMVKAFGYGSGALELARLVEHERVHYLGVAYADEGIELRSQGITLPIMVMNPEPVAMETLHRFRLEAEVYDMRSLQEAIASAKQMPDAPSVHIKLDTGMHRLGFMEEELPRLIEALRGQQALKVASILSHLVAAEDPAQDDFTRAQITLFTRMATAIGEVLGYKPMWHLANSAGISRWPEAHFDMVRVGIGLHGIGANPEETTRLMPTVSLRTPIAQLKDLHSGDTVGYNRKGIIQGERRIATLPIGYADGLSRRLGNGVGRVWVNDRPAPIVGNVCMDMCMVDVTGIPCAIGDLAVVFDAQHPVTEVARDMGTIPYEVLTGISQRVKRVYTHG